MVVELSSNGTLEMGYAGPHASAWRVMKVLSGLAYISRACSTLSTFSSLHHTLYTHPRDTTYYTLTILRSTRSTQPTITLRPQHSTNLAETFAVPNHPRPRISPSPWGASQDDPISITHLLNASDRTTTTYPRDPRMSVAYILNPINSNPNPNISTPNPHTSTTSSNKNHPPSQSPSSIQGQEVEAAAQHSDGSASVVTPHSIGSADRLGCGAWGASTARE